MNIKHIDSIIRLKLCPKCAIGMTRELTEKIYRCDYSMCNETYDFSLLTDDMIKMLLAMPAKHAN